jgi:hypothetical protein
MYPHGNTCSTSRTLGKDSIWKKVKKPALSALYRGEETANLQLRDDNNPAADRNSPSPRTLKIQEVENDHSIQLQVPEKLTKPDQFISQVKGILSKQKPNSYNYIGVVSSVFPNGIYLRTIKS